MIQGSQIGSSVFGRVALGLAKQTMQPMEPAAIGSAIRTLGAVKGLTRADHTTINDTVTALSRIGTSGIAAFAKTEGLTAELVRAETMLQVAQEAITAIENLYGGMQDLAELALNEELTGDYRAELDAAFQELKQDIKDIIDATVFDGEHLLEGGDGPDGEFVISLSAVDTFGKPIDILIPSASAIVNLEGFEDANLLSVDAARMVMDGAETVTGIFKLQHDLIELQRATVQQIYETEVAPNQSLADFVGSFDAPKYAAGLSHLVADLVLAGGEVPFENSAERLRGIF